MAESDNDAAADKNKLELISATAAWVAGYRAVESRRPDRHFNDPYAHLFASPTHAEADDGSDLASGVMVQRTVVFDEMIAKLVAEEPLDLVVNLAAGYDTRPYRLALRPDLNWVEVDLPHVLERKRAVLAEAAPRCRLTSIALDLSQPIERQRLLSDLGRESSRALIVTEGILLYLEEADAADLARSLHGQPSFQLWLTDIMSPGARRRMNVQAKSILSGFGTTLRFAPESGAEFFRPLGWDPILARPTMQEMIRLGRGPNIDTLRRATQGQAQMPPPSSGVDGTVLLRRSLSPNIGS